MAILSAQQNGVTFSQTYYSSVLFYSHLAFFTSCCLFKRIYSNQTFARDTFPSEVCISNMYNPEEIELLLIL